MDLGLAGQVVVVTGASKGIGFACAEAFAREGARVALISRSRANLDAALARITDAKHRPVAFTADLVDAAQSARVIDDVEAALGPIDVLVNSAGAAKRYAPGDLTAQAWHDAMDAKFFSYIHPLDIVVRRMAARGRGSVINIVGAGGKTANPVHIPGGAANAALMLATAGLAAAHGRAVVEREGLELAPRQRPPGSRYSNASFQCSDALRSRTVARWSSQELVGVDRKNPRCLRRRKQMTDQPVLHRLLVVRGLSSRARTIGSPSSFSARRMSGVASTDA